VQLVQLFDSWANLLSPAQFAEFSLPYAQRVIDGVRAQRPSTPLIFHANGGAACDLYTPWFLRISSCVHIVPSARPGPGQV
jgi:uroporphyrinogen-III decarboxylase